MKNILKGLEYKILMETDFKKFTGIEYDSRKIKQGDIFAALEGAELDGHDYIDKAVENGAKLILVSKEVIMKHPVSYILVKDLRQKLGFITSNLYDHPQKKLKIIGITGTNGKTTVTYMMEKLLGEKKCARIGTVEYKIGDEVIPAPNTTPESADLVKLCQKAVDKGLKYLIMEVSSHSLSMGRVEMLDFDAAVFTNLTEEHLDYHKTMEEYFLAKRKLFTKLKKPNTAVINIDDEYGKRLYEEFGGISYGMESGDLRGEILGIKKEGKRVKINFGDMHKDITLKILGRYNIYNLLGALGAAYIVTGDMEKLLHRVKEIKSAPGRFEIIDEGQNFTVIVDFAHTSDALENVLKNIRELKTKRIITIFGCGGDRDTIKRPIMGSIAEKYSDLVIVTSDNPRTEDPVRILKDIKKGIHRPDTMFEVDRERAIEDGVALAREGDILLITGKGHEDYQVIGHEKVHFDDREMARKYIKQLKGV